MIANVLIWYHYLHFNDISSLYLNHFSFQSMLYVFLDFYYHLLGQNCPLPGAHSGPFISQQTGCTDSLLSSMSLRSFLNVNEEPLQAVVAVVSLRGNRYTH